MSAKKICVWSGKRGGFGALTPTMRAIQDHDDLELALVVTDQHLYDKFGRTIREVEGQFPVAAAIDMEQAGDSNEERARAVGLCLQRSVDVLADLKPDALLVIGDRGEVFAACIAAHNMRIAIAHVQGGDLSGSLDEPVRHAITKLSHIHFPSTEQSAERIHRMGEEPWRIHVAGDTHIDQILLGTATAEDELRQRYELPPDEPFVLLLQHSDSTVPQASRAQIDATLAGVAKAGLRTMLVYPCSDQGYEGIIDGLEAARGGPGISVHQNIPAPDFIGLQKIAACLVGNSSAGLIEAPYFALGAVNVGDRQIGRERAANVIDVPYDGNAVAVAIQKALYDDGFAAAMARTPPPFGDGTAYRHITDTLAGLEVDERLLNKRMSY
ncbi:MAG: UDP-N-acetylglucosamine 2-epimerase (hydrolyzing) [Rhodospirillaceae bacterium]|jgi:GDP/UDP-N,N'-diacetylbacillosamine 2-epimerase (hydrolysing)|nr:UDP-N-acetylglucosamine 2-epimerase (hydrolyzing) [Rhodospirillaceae bacterium]MBT5194354.1 UDP-N-acetylglucosamine 2-epimerase (hydrolyzing) [Rhodospirillaceae bacterium]MBT5897099.1 UDP-N-acetylglucosamine 2-epimerase (hydrolyzing) [Rhodospirillaceae bacterium]MBT6427589.1 UDP-N-acetylglucosamine 2-epimerase (hydrolyzing) [Rhodospirillaceae bacterium]